jgi:hypothetical protein
MGRDDAASMCLCDCACLYLLAQAMVLPGIGKSQPFDCSPAETILGMTWHALDEASLTMAYSGMYVSIGWGEQRKIVVVFSLSLCRMCQARVIGVMGVWKGVSMYLFAVIAAGLVPPTSDDLKQAKSVTVDLTGIALVP